MNVRILLVAETDFHKDESKAQEKLNCHLLLLLDSEGDIVVKKDMLNLLDYDKYEYYDINDLLEELKDMRPDWSFSITNKIKGLRLDKDG